MEKYINRRQICKYQNAKALLEFNDKLQMADVEKAGNLHSQFSKINVIAKDYSQGTGDKAVDVALNIDPETMKYIANEILTNNTSFNFQEQKILKHKTNGEGNSFTSRIDIKFNPQMRLPWNLVLEFGWGEIENTEIGGTMLKKGTYKAKGRVKLFLSDMEAKKLMLTVNDYIRAWEVSAIRTLLPLRDQAEKEERAARLEKGEQQQFSIY